MEAAYQVQKGSASFDLSEQYLESGNQFARCNEGFDVLCASGYYLGFGWVPLENTEPGAIMESVMPYDETSFDCQPIQANWTTIQGRLVVTPAFDNGSSLAFVEDLKGAIQNFGPISVSVCASNSFKAYTGGVYAANDCDNLNHQVSLVGWDNHTESWILKSSWGTNWRENGYMRIKWGNNGVGYEPIYAVASPLH